ncbi:unnamed protein product [Amaranthus hypochondriacus]
MSTASYGRSRSGDRFYCPPQVRRQKQLLEHKQKLEEKEEIKRDKQLNQHQNRHVRRQKSATNATVVPQQIKMTTTAKSTSSSLENRVESDDCASSTATTTTATTLTPAASVSSSHSTNLDRFLEFTTPFVPAQYLSKTSRKGVKTQEDEFLPYFVLGDLWESFKEWSAYGAGVPLLLNGSDSVVQYYVPSLSGIQLYIDRSKSSPRTRMPDEESDESSRETSSDGSNDFENGFYSWNQHDHSVSTPQGMKELSPRFKPSNCSSSDEGEISSSPGVLMFEYFEHDSPFIREPLADKISLLASRFPELNTYRSCDLSPSSWISVAWYPIYRIPTGPTLQNLDSCFLTFHSLTTPSHGVKTECLTQYGSCPREISNGFNTGLKMPLPTFGMASYKFKISVWGENGVEENQKANSLLRAADEWLRILNVHHPDYSFFVSKNFNCR